jgi:lysophospholipase L1-like esterase
MRRLLSAWLGTLVLASAVTACGGGAGGDSPASNTRLLSTLGSVTSTVPAVPKIHMLGDSTMTAYAEDRRPQMGWGEAMPQFFDTGVEVDNWALGGRSSRSFYYEATRWPAILPKISAGDYVIIQFAHNDQKSGGDYAQFGTYAFCSDGSNDGEACVGRPDKVDPTVDISEHSYYQFLKKYVQQVRARGANPILMSPIVRKYFSGTSITPQGRHDVAITGGETYARGDYVAAMRAVANRYAVPFVDITAETRTIVESYGNAAATANLYIAADSTHPQVLFANLIAKRAVEGMRGLNILAGHMVPVTSLIPSPGTLDWSTRYVGMATTKTVTLSAFDLMPAQGTMTISAPASFELSLDNAIWSRNVAVDYSNGAFTQALYVRFTPTEARVYSGNVGFAVGNAVLPTTIALHGEGVSAAGGIASYASWFKAGFALAPATDGLVTADDAIVHRLVPSTAKVIAVDGQDTTVARYVANSPTRDNDQYLQFAVRSGTGTLSVDTISAYLTSSGGSTVVADIEYSLNPDFSGSTRLNTSPLSFVKDTFTARLSYPVVVQVPPAATMYVRIYPWNSAGVTGKTLAVYGVTVSGSATSQPSTPSFVDATSSFSLLRSGLAWNRVTNKYSASITLTNTSGATLAGPFHLVFNNLTPGATLDNATGMRDGAPYIAITGTSIAAGSSITVPLVYSNPDKAPIGYTNKVFIANL